MEVLYLPQNQKLCRLSVQLCFSIQFDGMLILACFEKPSNFFTFLQVLGYCAY